MTGEKTFYEFVKFRDLKKKPYWGNHFWTEGSCVDTVGLDSEMIRKCVQYQEKQEHRAEQHRKLFSIENRRRLISMAKR